MQRRSRTLPLVVALALLLILVLAGLFLALRGPSAPPAPAPATPGTVPAGSATPQAQSPFRVYFTTPRYPDDPNAHHGGPDEPLAALMRTATTTLDVCDYDFDLQDVAHAMADAAGRGVRVRMVTDTDTLTSKDRAVRAAWAVLKQANIPVVDDQREPIMHNKFTVVDGHWVSTGSMNYTDGDAYRLNNNLVIVQSPQLAANYTAEFEKMFVHKQFGPRKPPGVPNPTLTIGTARVENYFAPEDKVAGHILGHLEVARQSIHFMAFSFTDDALGKAMLARAQAGVDVQGVFETTGSNTRFSEFGRLKQAGLPVWQDGNPYPMHHKVMVIDGATTIFGSYNFSASADKDNDENVLIVTDPALAAQFEAEYQRVKQVAIDQPAKGQQPADADSGRE